MCGAKEKYLWRSVPPGKESGGRTANLEELSGGGMSRFTVYPAIDLRSGRVVRLKEGDPNRQTTYSADPARTAGRWLVAGARWLHIVNLDGAFAENDTANLEALRLILETTKRFN